MHKRFPMVPLTTDLGRTHTPLVPLLIEAPASGRPFRYSALVDSGASFNFATEKVARIIGLELSGLPIASYNGQQVGRVAELDLTLDPASRSPIPLTQARVVFVPSLPGQLLIVLGQIDGLDRAAFIQLHHHASPNFILRPF